MFGPFASFSLHFMFHVSVCAHKSVYHKSVPCVCVHVCVCVCVACVCVCCMCVCVFLVHLIVHLDAKVYL